jgi:NAD(P)H-dependent FMN reductase
MPTLGVIIASTREGRAGLPIADWFVAVARQHGGFDLQVLDLKAIALPMLEEPNHPRLQRYTQESTKAWSAQVAACDAFVIVTPEYNFSSPPALVNALDHLYLEWNYKPAGFVSYGGVSGGMRSVQSSKLLLTTLKMVPLYEAVVIPFFSQQIDADTGAFKGNDTQEKAAVQLLTELVRWTSALRTLRQ